MSLMWPRGHEFNLYISLGVVGWDLRDHGLLGCCGFFSFRILIASLLICDGR
jgi:hypothetical protein